MEFSVHHRRKVFKQLVIVFVEHTASVAVGHVSEFLKLRDVSVVLTPFDIPPRRFNGIKTVSVHKPVYIGNVLKLGFRELSSVSAPGILLIGIIRILTDVQLHRHSRVYAALVIRYNHADVRVGKHFPYVFVRYPDRNCADVLPVFGISLYTECLFRRERFSRPRIRAVRIQPGMFPVSFRRHERHIDLHSGKTELLGKQRFLGIRMSRKPLRRKISDHLNIVKYKPRHIIRERLYPDTSDIICRTAVELFA